MLPLFYAATLYLLYNNGYPRFAFWIAAFLIANILFTLARILFYPEWYQASRIQAGMEIQVDNPRYGCVPTILTQGVMAAMLLAFAFHVAYEIGYLG